jgi:YfiH family protein
VAAEVFSRETGVWEGHIGLFGYREARGPVEVAFTDRRGGVSTGSYATLNLALEGGDDPEAVAENLRRVGAGFNDGGPMLGMRQVHGAEVVVIEDHQAGTPICDGVVTTAPGVALMARGADCVPLLLADPDARVVAAAHAGRKGLQAGIAQKTVGAMRRLGASSIAAWVGPHICGRCYEVPASMRHDVSAVVPAARAETSWGTPSIDLGAGITAQLSAEGVDVLYVGPCTRESDDLHSYRRDGVGAGRLAGLVRLKP